MLVLEHEHPLNLVDLQPNYPLSEEGYDDDDEDEDDEDEVVTRKNFRCRQCDRCNEEINWFHRYYYKCAHSCEYSLHKLCGELPLTLKHTSHPHHTLTLHTDEYKSYCQLCEDVISGVLYYDCSQCYYKLDVNCAKSTNEDRVIYHPSHFHPLISFFKPLLCGCNACGKEHKGIFYSCSICPKFCIHSDCVYLPKTLIIQDATDHNFSHSHPLILSYSFPKIDQKANFNPRCRACNGFFDNEKLWIFKCQKCRYYTHLECATSREEPFMSIISSFGNRKIKKDFEDSDYPDLMYLPFPDDSCSTLKHKFLKKDGYESCAKDEGYTFHQHPLILVISESSIDNTMPTTSNKNLVYCHNPMKKIELLCNGCLRPITSVPFFKCANENENCNFVLHEWCTRIPHELPDYPDHPQHTLILHPNVPRKFFSVFICDVCLLPCNGFVYSCVQCDYHVDVKCGHIPEKVTHEAHPGHLLSRVQNKAGQDFCRICVGIVDDDDPFSFLCHTCNVNIHVICALLLPREIRHKYDKHPMSLSYLPMENHKSEYFCEICEVSFDPERSFYHCNHCVQTIHSHCAPVILQSERAIKNTYFGTEGIYQFVNIKFGGTHNIKGHRHPLSFTQGISSDGICAKCHRKLSDKMIFKCEPCEYALDLKCCEELSK